MTSPSEPPAPGSSKDPSIEAFAAQLREAKGDLPGLLQPLSKDKRDEIISRTLEARGQTNVIAAESRFRARRLFAAGSALALAASILLFVVFRSSHGSALLYSLDISGDAEVRGSDTHSEGPVRLRPSTRLVVRIRPDKPGPAAALRVVVVREGKTRALDVSYRVESGGVFVVDAPAKQALGDQVNGAATLVFVVGPLLPSDDEVQKIALDPNAKSTDAFAILRRDVVFSGWETARRDLDIREIELAGCQGLSQGPVCEFATDTELRLWLPIENAKGRLIGAEAKAEVVGKNVLGGTRFRIKPESSTTSIEITAADGNVAFRMPLRAVQEDPELKAAFSALQKNECDEVAKRLDAAEKNPTNALAVLRMRARRARRCGDIGAAKQLLEEASNQARKEGRLSDEADDRHLLAFTLVTRDFDFATAKTFLWPENTAFEQCPECRMDAAYYRSIWALETGRYDEALQQLGRVSASAERLDLQDRLIAARNQKMEVLATLGRPEEAAELARASLTDASTIEDPCAQVKLRTSAAWALLRGIEAESAGATNVLREARAAVDAAKAHCPASLVNALVNAAYAEIHAQEAEQAKALLNEARTHVDAHDERMASWLEALEIEVVLLDEPQRALEILDKSSRQSKEAPSPELVFRSAAGKARALRKIGKTEPARKAFAEANEALDAWSMLVPLGEGRESFFEQQRKWATEAVDFEVSLVDGLADGTAEKEASICIAAAEAQRHWGRFFQTLTATEGVPLAEQTEYRRGKRGSADRPVKRSAEAATNPAMLDSEKKSVRLVYHPVHRGWVGFALERDGGATMARLTNLPVKGQGTTLEKPTAELTKTLLEPFTAAISRASNVETPGWGPLRRVPWEALPWKEKSFGDVVQVRYRLDLPATKESECSGRARALMVLDPSATLAGAEKSANEVRRGLSQMHFDVVELSGAAAEKKAVLNELTNPCTQLFHYDGHAAFGGRDGVHAALELSGEALTVADVLTLPRVPEAVTLLGCETAKDDGMGVAQAFLSRGAHQVLAAMDAVDDELSGEIARQLYAESIEHIDLAQSLRRATRAVRHFADGDSKTNGPSAKAWWLFRVLSR